MNKSNYNLIARDDQDADTLAKLDTIIKTSVKQGFELLDDKSSMDMCEAEINPIECVSRDGFIAHTHNSGGYGSVACVYSRYDIDVNHPEVDKALEDIESTNIELGTECFISDNKEKLKALEIADKDVDYHTLTDKGQDQLAAELDEYQRDDEECYLIKLQAMYQGIDENTGKHIVYLSLQINWEFPYFRDYLPGWAGSDKMHFSVEKEVISDVKSMKASLKKATKALVNSFLKEGV